MLVYMILSFLYIFKIPNRNNELNQNLESFSWNEPFLFIPDFPLWKRWQLIDDIVQVNAGPNDA